MAIYQIVKYLQLITWISLLHKIQNFHYDLIADYLLIFDIHSL